MLSRSLRQAAGVVAIVLATCGPALAGTLRICADPDNLPFSKSEGPERGLYVELAELVSQRLGDTPEYVWWLTFNQRKALRNTILQDGCDVVFALPANEDYRVRGVVKTRAFLDVGYAVVGPAALRVTRLADLRGRKVGVLHGSPPHILLASVDGFTTASFRENDEALAALAHGDIDAAILWGPSAGYENQRHFNARWAITPVTGEGLSGSVVVGVRRDHPDLAARIDQALADLQPQILALAGKYGFPLARPVVLSRSDAVSQRDGRRALALAASRRVDAGAGWHAVVDEPSLSGGPVMADPKPVPPGGHDVASGRTRFNNVCSHCHGANGASPVSERDLRKLRSRYKDEWRAVASVTIREGRPTAGMPTWKATFDDQQIEELLAFLATIQR